MFHVSAKTSNLVKTWLETSLRRKQRIRIFYGDVETGRDWMEEHDTIGHIGRSTGLQPAPLLIKSSRSLGGGAVLTGNIVRITTKGSDGKNWDVYKHTLYHQPELAVKIPDYVVPVSFPVYAGDEHIATFGTRVKAERYIQFLKGDRNSK